MAHAYLETFNLKKTFMSNMGPLDILSGITMRFNQGHSYAIMGSSGSGKSTFMHLLAGIELPSSGSVHFNNTDISQLSSKQKDRFWHHNIGLVFQQAHLIKELSVIENVMLRGLIAGHPKTECRSKALRLLEQLGIADKALCAPQTLSGGQQQRVALARALFSEPAFLIADEPTGSLDSATTQELVALLFECQKSWYMGIIVSTHDTNIAYQFDSTYQLKNGTLTPIFTKNS